MKKINAFLLIIVLGIGNYYKAQELDVIFEVDFKPSTKDSLREKELMILKINTHEKKSIFQSLGNQQVDSINRKASELKSSEEKEVLEKTTSGFSPEKSSFNFIISKDLSTGDLWLKEKIGFNKYQSIFTFPKESWKLMDENKNIHGYLCKKAEIAFGGRIWIAYYTSQIPIQDGPYKFYGLPGLILELSSTDKAYSFSLKSLANKPTEPNTNFEKIIIIKPEQFLKLKQNYIQDPASSIKRLTENTGLLYTSKYNGKENNVNSKDLAKTIEDESASWQNSHDNFIEKGEIWLK